jgi:hypothetical protein
MLEGLFLSSIKKFKVKTPYWSTSPKGYTFSTLFRHLSIFGRLIKGCLRVSPYLEHLCARPQQGYSQLVVTGEAWLYYHYSLLARSSTFSLDFLL